MVINIIGFIPLWISLFSQNNQATNEIIDQLKSQYTMHNIIASKAELLDSQILLKDSLKSYLQIDTLKINTIRTKQDTIKTE